MSAQPSTPSAPDDSKARPMLCTRNVRRSAHRYRPMENCADRSASTAVLKENRPGCGQQGPAAKEGSPQPTRARRRSPSEKARWPRAAKASRLANATWRGRETDSCAGPGHRPCPPTLNSCPDSARFWPGRTPPLAGMTRFWGIQGNAPAPKQLPIGRPPRRRFVHLPIQQYRGGFRWQTRRFSRQRRLVMDDRPGGF